MRTAKWILLLSLFVACSPRDHEHKPLPRPEAPTQAKGAPAYSQVRPIFEQNCAVCHPSRSAPNWLEYVQAQAYAKNGLLERKVFTERSMPPPGSAQAVSISEHDRALLATWARAGGPLEAQAAPAGGGGLELPQNPALSLQQQCFQCHGQGGQGNPSQAGVPRLAGQNEIYLSRQIANFKWRSRLDPSNGMNEVAQNLSDAQISEMAAFFAKAEPPPAPEPADKLAPPEMQTLFARGQSLATDNCVACHMNPLFGGRSNVPEVPLLSNQSKVYLRNQLLYFRNGERVNALMNQIAKDLSDDDIAALSLYFAHTVAEKPQR